MSAKHARRLIVDDLGSIAGDRALRVVMDATALCDNPQERFVVLSYALMSIGAAAAASYAEISGEKHDVPTKELIIRVVEAVFP